MGGINKLVRKKTLFLSVFLLFLFSFLYTPLISLAQTKENPLCGPNSLLVVCKKLGVETTLDELKHLSDYDEIKGTTMAGLYKAAQSKGLYAEGMKISFDDLSKLKMPIIAYFWENHCVVIDGFKGDTLTIIDTPRDPYSISKEDFAKFYSGFSLLISKNKFSFPKIKSKGPDIRFEEYVYNFGVIEQGEKTKIDHIFKFRNAGNEELVISYVIACCGASATLLSEKSIPPQGKGEIKATVDVGGKRGEQDYRVHVYSNDPVTQVVQLQIKGVVKAEPMKTGIVVLPENIYLGDINKSALSGSRKILILKPEDEELNITKTEPSSKYISVKISQREEERYKGIEKSYQGFEIEVSISPDIPIGKFEEKITIYTTSEKYPKIEIPVTGNIKGDIEFRPNAFFFGIVRLGETSSRKVTILTTGSEPLKIEKTENPLQFVSITIAPKTEGREYEITATLNDNAPAGTIIKGNITIYTHNPDQSQIVIPVYALVKQ